MNIVDNSLTIVLLGDWNKLYVQPEWVANNIFCKPEMEIGVEAQGIEFNISYKCDNIVINPSQERIVITAINTDKETIEFLANCATNYINKAKTPQMTAYGLNIDFVETENTLLADFFDSVSDTLPLLRLNYNIVSSQISRTVVKDGNVTNIQYTQEQSLSKLHFNEHHANPETETITFEHESIVAFIERTKEIAVALGYEFEEDNE